MSEYRFTASGWRESAPTCRVIPLRPRHVGTGRRGATLPSAGAAVLAMSRALLAPRVGNRSLSAARLNPQALQSLHLLPALPASDVDLCKQFYVDLGFHVVSADAERTYLRHGSCGFLLQPGGDFGDTEHSMEFQVCDVAAWWHHVLHIGLIRRYGVRAVPPARRAPGVLAFILFDPSGVLWRIGQWD